MLRKDQLFNVIKDSADYKTVGKDVQYKIKLIDGTLYLLFQESRSKEDWKTNFNFPIKCYKKQVNRIYAHRGFVEAWKSCNDLIIADFRNSIKEHYQEFGEIVIAGWSFGGAMAQLAVEDLYFRTGIEATLITYGSPKIIFIGKKVFKDSCTANSVQYAHVNDIVPLVPPIYFSFYKKRIGKFSLKKLWRTSQHCIYGEKELYL